MTGVSRGLVWASIAAGAMRRLFGPLALSRPWADLDLVWVFGSCVACSCVFGVFLRASMRQTLLGYQSVSPCTTFELCLGLDDSVSNAEVHKHAIVSHFER